VLALILVALSLGLSNFAAAIGMGISGTSARTRLKVGIIFGCYDDGSLLVGLRSFSDPEERTSGPVALRTPAARWAATPARSGRLQRSIISTCRPGVRLYLPLDVVVSEASGRRAGYSVVPWTI
jgi:hypothetical protein